MNLPEEFENRMKELLGEEYEAFADVFRKEDGAKGLRFSLSRLSDPFREFERTGNGRTENERTENERTENGKVAIPKNLISEFTHGSVPWCASGFYGKEESRPGKSIYHEAGAFYLQEPSAMVVAEIANVKPGEKVLDLCAAPGGKSTALGDALFGEGILVSNEIHPSRVRILSENIERMGISNALVLNETPEKIAELFPEFFDCVVVDAPCSGEGMFRKEEAALTEWSPENVEMCALRQKDILKEAVKCVAPGGRLVYSTCTFAPAENEENIEWFLKEFPEFKLSEIPEEVRKSVSEGISDCVFKQLSKEQTEEEPETENSETESLYPDLKNCVRIWPHRQKGEGHFAAVLVREGNIGAERNEEDSLKNADFSGKKKNRNAKKERGKNIALSREMRESFKVFADETLTEQGKNRFREITTYSPTDRKIAALFGDNLYLEPLYFPGKGVKIERAGLHMGTFGKNRFEPSLALARVLKSEDVKNVLALTEEQEETALAYLRGEQLGGIPNHLKGWTLVTYEGYSLGFGKASGGVLKNHYPKGLRVNLK